MTIGPSRDNNHHVCFIDSIRVWGQTKDAFGWPEDAPGAVLPNSGGSGSSGTDGTNATPLGSGENGADAAGSGVHYPYALNEGDPQVKVATTEASQVSDDRDLFQKLTLSTSILIMFCPDGHRSTHCLLP